MFENDYPLIGTPALTALILRQAEAGEVTVDACARRLAALQAEAKEAPPLPPDATRQRIAWAIRQLEIAGLLAPSGPGCWHLTARGRTALDRHPEGVDPSDLGQYPEYAAHIRARAHSAAQADPRVAGYDEGYHARRDGQPFNANPHAPSSVDYLAWENGWMQALDDDHQA